MTGHQINIIKRNGERAWLYEEAMRKTSSAKLLLDEAFHDGANAFVKNTEAALRLIQDAQVLMETRAELPVIEQPWATV